MALSQSLVMYANQPRDLSLWFQHKDLFQQLYVVENKRLEDVKDIMETQHGFPSMSLNVYETIFRKKLNLRKNLKRSDWIPIGDHLEKRKQQGKKSELYLNGTLVKSAKVKKEVGRHRTRTDLAMRRSRLLTPPLPDGIHIITPPGSPLPFNNTQSTIDGLHLGSMQSPIYRPYLVLQDHNAPWGSTVDDFDTLSHLRLRRNSPFNKLMLLMQNLTLSESSIPGQTNEDPSDSQHSISASGHDSSLASLILPSGYPSPLLPGSAFIYNLQHFDASPRSLFSGNANPFEFLIRTCFMLSNGHEFDNIKMLLDWIGLSADLRILMAFFSLESPTVFAFWERLMVEVHNLKHVKAFEIIVEIGLEVYSQRRSKNHLINCLYTAAWIGSEKAGRTARRLLDYGVSPKSLSTLDISSFGPGVRIHFDSSFSFGLSEVHRFYPTPLHLAAQQLDPEMIKILISSGALLDCETWGRHLSCLRLFLDLGGTSPLDYALMTPGPSQLQTVKLLLESGSKVNAVYSREKKRCHEHSACSYTKSALSWHSPNKPLMVTDRLRQSKREGDTELYKLISQYRDPVKSFVTVSDITTAARVDVGILKYYLSHSSNPQPADKKLLLEIALSEASAHSDTTASACLLEFGVDSNVRDLSSLPRPQAWGPEHFFEEYRDPEWRPWVWSPLFRAAKNLDVSMMRLLCRHGANINEFNFILATIEDWEPNQHHNSKDDDEKRFLDRLEIIKFIFDSGFDVSRYGREAMIAASQASQLHPSSEVCDILHAKGVGFDIRKDDKDLLQLSIRSSLEKVNFLLDRGLKFHSVPSNTDGNTMLHDALVCHYLYPDRSKIVDLLLENGVDCTAYGGGLTVLESSLSVKGYTCSYKHACQEILEVFEKLFRRGAPVNKPSERPKNCGWKSILTQLIEINASDNLIHAVIDAGADIHQRGQSTTTPLQRAVWSRRLGLAYELINRGADVNASTCPEMGRTVLQAACWPSYVDKDVPLQFTEFLIEMGAHVNEPGDNALGGAALTGSLNVVCLLLDHGAEINSSTKPEGPTALDFAAEFGRLDMVQLLIDAGAKSGRPGATGFDEAIKRAQNKGHFAIVTLLEDLASGIGKRSITKEVGE